MLFLQFYNQFVYFFVFFAFLQRFFTAKIFSILFFCFGLLPFKYEARRKNIAKFLLTNFAAPSSLLLSLTT